MSGIEDIRKPIETELENFNRLFDATLSQADGLLGQICQGISKRKGKLMRPILVLLIAKGYGEITPSAYYSALTLELLHNASLVHDDIVDESDERRGVPSARALFGNKAAVLAGDYLLSASLESASMSGNINIVKDVSQLGKRLSEGEIIQLSNTQHNDFSEETYYQVIRLKTASLFATAARLGAISAGQDDSVIRKMERFGEIIGLCFQIRDDIFDYYDNHIGKPTGNDMLEGKLTLPALYALNSTCDTAMLAVAGKVKKGIATPQEITRLVNFSKANGGIDYACASMAKLSAEAKALLTHFGTSEIRQSLVSYVNFVSQRTV